MVWSAGEEDKRVRSSVMVAVGDLRVVIVMVGIFADIEMMRLR